MKTSTLMMVAGVLALFLSPILYADDPGMLVGQWKYNKKDSEDAKKKIQDAMQQGGGHSGGHGNWSGGHGGGHGGWGGGGHGGYHGDTEGGHSAEHAGMGDLFDPPDSITISYTAPEFQVVDSNGKKTLYYTDGREVNEDLGDGKKLNSVEGWAEDALVVKTTSPDGRESTRSYYLARVGNQLYVKFEMQPRSSSEPITIVQAYDPVTKSK